MKRSRNIRPSQHKPKSNPVSCFRVWSRMLCVGVVSIIDNLAKSAQRVDRNPYAPINYNALLSIAQPLPRLPTTPMHSNCQDISKLSQTEQPDEMWTLMCFDAQINVIFVLSASRVTNESSNNGVVPLWTRLEKCSSCWNCDQPKWRLNPLPSMHTKSGLSPIGCSINCEGIYVIWTNVTRHATELRPGR